MCGIAGFFHFDGHDPESARRRVRKMIAPLAHRGPDGEGVWVDDHLALGHRRLAIIDLAGGAQPMATGDGNYRIVFNGEIYNFRELRRSLETEGHRFRTRSDTEVILVGYRQWGERIVDKLHGMFAFALWDALRRRLFLARDRVGKKPLYTCSGDGFVAFASELGALLAGGLLERAVDREALDCYLTFGYVPAPRTIFAGARKLAAAHTLTVDAGGERVRRYWGLSFAAPRRRSLDDAAEEAAAALDRAVGDRLVSEVPLGAFLSGGLDSTLVVASMARQMERPVLTNTIGFAERGFDELPLARRVADHLGTDHREFRVETGAEKILEEVAGHLDEPLADASALPTWQVCRMARENVTVALSGDGGDEGFGGYTFRYRPHQVESRWRARLPAALRGPLFGLLGSGWPASARLPRILRLKTIFENLAVGDAEAFCRDLAWLRADTRLRLYRPEFLDELAGFTPLETVMPLYAGSDAPDPLGRSQAADIGFYLTDDVLVKVDRMSMAHSLEVRSPLLDHRVLELAASLPASLKLEGGSGKLVLRRLARERLPAAVLDQPKRGFAIPTARWLRRDLRGPMAAAVADRDSLAHEVLRPAELDRIWRQHLAGARDHSVLLWGVLMLHRWQHRFLGATIE